MKFDGSLTVLVGDLMVLHGLGHPPPFGKPDLSGTLVSANATL